MSKMSLDFSLRVGQFSDVLLATEFRPINATSNIEVESGVLAICKKLLEARNANKNIYIVGNGGSAGVAAHAVTDLFNVAKLKATTLHESSLLTCMANDFGYENAVARMLGQLLNPADIVIVISSSGNSMNMRNAANVGRQKGAFVLTLSGFKADNPLRQLGDLNIWLPSTDYGFVEIGHQFILHNIADRFNSSLLGEFSG
jgi:D-sedoheptulose 7-phosphate isomerase